VSRAKKACLRLSEQKEKNESATVFFGIWLVVKGVILVLDTAALRDIRRRDHPKFKIDRRRLSPWWGTRSFLPYSTISTAMTADNEQLEADQTADELSSWKDVTKQTNVLLSKKVR
jgi:hypothetical protein